MLPFPAHTEQLDFLDFVRQALECQFYIRLTDEMDLKTETAFQPLLRLGTNHFGGDGFQCLDLCPQSLPVLLSRQVWNNARCAAPQGVRREANRPGSFLQHQVRPLIGWLIRHGSGLPFSCPFSDSVSDDLQVRGSIFRLLPVTRHA